MRSGSSITFQSHLIATAMLALALLGCEATVPSAPTSSLATNIAFAAGERLTYRLVNIQGDLLGSGVLATHRDGSTLLLEQRYEAAMEGAAAGSSDRVSLAVDSTTLQPLHGERDVVRVSGEGGERRESYQWTYTPAASGAVLHYRATRDGEAERGSIDLREHYYDNEASLWLWRTLAFDADFDGSYVSANPIAATQQTVKLQTPSTETIRVPAGSFEVWRLVVRNGRSLRSAWIHAEAPHEVIRWDNGDVVFELVSREPGG